MFNLINIGERAGSGIPNIFAVWEQHGWTKPVFKEQFNPDRTFLSLAFDKTTDRDTVKDTDDTVKDTDDTVKDTDDTVKDTDDTVKDTDDTTKDTDDDTVKDTVSGSRRRLLELLTVNSKMTIKAISAELGINERNVKKNLKGLKDAGLIERAGSSRRGHWIVKKV